jgi:hypothetical protein
VGEKSRPQKTDFSIDSSVISITGMRTNQLGAAAQKHQKSNTDHKFIHFLRLGQSHPIPAIIQDSIDFLKRQGKSTDS